jgi:CRISPR-associated protein Csd1
VLLQELRRLAESPEVAADLTREGYARKRVRHLIQLDRDGGFVACVDLAGQGRGAARGQEMEVPDVVRSSATRPLLLADGPDYLFGLDPDPKKAQRAAERHRAFVELVEDCARRTGLPEVEAVLRYLREAEPPPGLDPRAELVTFEVEGRRVVDLPEVARYWVSRLRPEEGEGALPCLVCGQMAPPARVWPVLIKGIPGGQTSGNQLASANAEAFESYGLKGSRTSPACLDCAAAVGKALNWLLGRDAHHLRLAGSVFVFWTRDGGHFDLARLLSDPSPEDVRELLQAPWTGRRGATAIEPARFFAAELSASGSRVAVRSWVDTTVPEVRRHVARYLSRLAVVPPAGGEPGPLGIGSLLRATARDWQGVHPEAGHDLMQVALTGAPVPPRLMELVVRRNRAEQRVTRPRAALLRLALLASGGDRSDESHDREEIWMSKLETDEPSPAYLCGRLLAELEAAQRAALGRINATVTDRYYGAASSSPATVFGPLLRNARHHLARLRKDKGAIYQAIDGRITEILARLQGEFPAVLTLKDQARFALGYYHQKAEDRAAARTRRELREALDDQDEGEETPEDGANRNPQEGE